MSHHAGSEKTYGKCLDCSRQRTAVAWCKNCDIAFFRDNLRHWSSGNSKIDEVIKYTQLNAKESMDYLEWIEFSQVELIENIN
ncbi:kinase-like domain-containing protein [Rhizophagus clarus]|uniref:Kinase-like domain-containing protein n=1 Tax=Rhizophagus clarus TaxID=94130 RepID=A0A8H3M2Z3_9GLOM|nr:kinase-like domain-containing protein [Rhizophagus clarus]